jgi:hypothetical protein
MVIFSRESAVEPEIPWFNTSLYRVTRQVDNNPMLHTEKKIKIIRDKLSRIGISEKSLADDAILATYSINKFGNLCPVNRIQ